MNTPLFRIYSRIILWCYRLANSTNLLARLVLNVIENTLCLASVLLSKGKRIKFPSRTLGSRFWVCQWRVEYLMGWWEYETTPWVRKYVRPGMTVVDIGAHIGYYTDLFSRLVQSHGKVYAFEASPENYPILVNNMDARRRYNVIAIDRAVSDQNTVQDLYVSPGHSNHSLVEGRSNETQGKIPIQAVRLEDYLTVDKIDFIKMDVEGAEPRVLEGMRKLIKSSPNLVMVVEYNQIVLSKAYSSPQILLNTLSDLGFEYKAILEDGSLGDIPSDTKTINLLCIRKTAKVSY
ncbi:MAG TPA: hypothetical protein DCX53_07605 [Anaerolineae bacterium]|nr:hypothetical protein [Anaerolineae bacterium]